jgi:hypothetical protein
LTPDLAASLEELGRARGSNGEDRLANFTARITRAIVIELNGDDGREQGA